MSLNDNENVEEDGAPACAVWSSTDLAVVGKLGVGVQCGWTPTYPTAYIHGALYVKDRTDTGQLNFVVNTGPAAFPQLTGSKTAASQLDLTGSLRIVGPPVGTPVDGAARIVIEGQADASGNDAVPLQLWRNSRGTSLNIVDATGKLGLGTLQPGAPLDVAGNTHIGGSLSIGDGAYSNSLTIQAAFSQEAPGTFTGQTNIDRIDGDTNSFRVGDLFQIYSAGNIIKTTQNSDFFEVKSIAEDHTWFTVVVPPATNFNGASIFIEQSAVGIKNRKGSSLLAVNRYGDVNIGGALVVAGDTTVGGVLNGSNIVREAQIANGAVTLPKLAPNSVGTTQLADNTITTAKFVDASVTLSKLAPNSVGTTQLADNTVTTAKLVDASVTLSKLGANSVGTSQITDNSVTTAKLVDNSVTTGKIGDNVVTSSKLVNDAVTTEKIAARSVTVDKLGTYMVAGIINPDGGVFSGTGFTATRTGTGLYNVNFNPPLGQVLGGSATQVYVWPMQPTGVAGDTTDNAIIVCLNTTLLRVKTGKNNGAAENRAFTFVIIAK